MCLSKLVLFFPSDILSRIAGSYSSSIFSSLRNIHTVFHSGCTNLHSMQQIKDSLFFTSLPTFVIRYLPILIWYLFDVLFGIYLMLPILTGVKWYLLVVLLITDVEHLFMCFLAICMPSLEKHLLRSSIHFFFSIKNTLYWGISN